MKTRGIQPGLMMLATLLLAPMLLRAEWTALPPLDMVNPQKVQLVTVDVAYVLGDNALLRSNDGGLSWQDVSPENIQAGYVVQTMHFFDENRGWLGGKTEKPYEGFLYQTSDGGSSWQTISPDSCGWILLTAMITPETGVAYDYMGNLWRSEDAGATWTNQRLEGFGMQDIAFNGNSGIIVGWDGTFDYRAVIWRSEDAGSNWTMTALGRNSGFLCMVDFPADATVYFSGGENKHILRSSNGGRDWDSIVVESKAVFDMKFIDAEHGFLAAAEGALLETRDACQSFTKVIERDVVALDFFGRRGMAVGTEGRVWLYTETTSAVDEPGSDTPGIFPAPNPVQSASMLNVAFTGFASNEPLSVHIYALTGAEVHRVHKLHTNLTSKLAFRLPVLPAGAYVLEVRDAQGLRLSTPLLIGGN